MADDVDGRQELLEEIRARQANINAYVSRNQPISNRRANISIISSAIAATLTAGPAAGGTTFAKTVQDGLGWEQSSSVWRLLCLAAVIVSVVAAIYANLNKSNDLAARISTAEACNVGLEGLRTELKIGERPLKDAIVTYRQLLDRLPFVETGAPLPPPTIQRYRRTAAFLLPAVAIVFAGLVLVVTVIGLVLGGVAAGSPGSLAPQTHAGIAPQLVLSPSQVRFGENYSATASGFLSGEDVQFSWTGPTNGVMKVSPADSSGAAIHGGIMEKDPPGNYTITVSGLRSGRTASAELVVQPGN